MPIGISPVAVALEPGVHRLITLATYSDGSGRLTVLDARSGTILRTIRGPFRPQTVVVDEHTHRAFILSDADVAVPPPGEFPAGLTIVDLTP